MNNKYSNIHKELKQEAPILASLQKPDLTAVPVGYFKKLEQQLVDVAKFTQADSHHVNQKLNDYFDNLEDTIMDKVSQSEAKVYDIHWGKSSSSATKLWKYAAAFIAGIIIVGTATNTVSKPDVTETVAIQKTEYLDYVLENIDDFDLNTMIDQGLITEADLDISTMQFNESLKKAEAYDLFDSEIDF